MKTKHTFPFAALLLCGTFTATSLFGAAFSTVSVYDENTDKTNAVNTDATGTLATFTSAVATASANGLGGVIDFDTPSVTPSGTIHSAEFGTSGGNFLQFTTLGIQGVTSGGSFNPISKTNGIARNGDANNFAFTFGNFSDAATGGNVLDLDLTQVGFTVLSRTNASYPLDVRATVTYSDLSTSVVTSNIGNQKGLDDTFMSFTASSGLTISSINLESFQTGTTTSVNTRIAIDDLGFIAIPEPSSAILFLLGALTFGLIVRRRR